MLSRRGWRRLRGRRTDGLAHSGRQGGDGLPRPGQEGEPRPETIEELREQVQGDGARSDGTRPAGSASASTVRAFEGRSANRRGAGSEATVTCPPGGTTRVPPASPIVASGKSGFKSARIRRVRRATVGPTPATQASSTRSKNRSAAEPYQRVRSSCVWTGSRSRSQTSERSAHSAWRWGASVSGL